MTDITYSTYPTQIDYNKQYNKQSNQTYTTYLTNTNYYTNIKTGFDIKSPDIPQSTPTIDLQQLHQQNIKETKQDYREINTTHHENKNMFIGIDFGTENSAICFYDTTAQKPTLIEYKQSPFIKSQLSYNNKGELITNDSSSTAQYIFKQCKNMIGKRYDELDEGCRDVNKGWLYQTEKGFPVYKFEIVEKQKGMKRTTSQRKQRTKKSTEMKEEKEMKDITELSNSPTKKQQRMEMTQRRSMRSSKTEDPNQLINNNSKENEEEMDKPRTLKVEKSPEEVAKDIFHKFREVLKEQCGINEDEVINCVLTVPAGYTQNQRESTIDIAKSANFNASLLNEPTAAALYYYDTAKETFTSKERLLVFDFGGGTLDVSIVDVDKIDEKFQFDVLASRGNTQLGGKTFDEYTYHGLKMKIEQHLEDYGCEMIKWTDVKEKKLRRIAEEIKISLSLNNDYNFDFESFYGCEDDCPDAINITVDEFDEWNGKIYEEAMKLISESVKKAKIEEKTINKVLLIGGTSKITKVRTMLIERFGEQKIQYGFDPMEAVVKGACIHAHNGFKIVDVLPADIKMERFDGSTITVFKENTSLPAENIIPIIPEEDYATKITISVYEGNKSVAQMNTLIDNYTFDGIASVPKDDAYIEIKFLLDEQGNLKIEVVDFNLDDDQQIKQIGQGKVKKSENFKAIIEEKLKNIKDEEKKKELQQRNIELTEEQNISGLLKFVEVVEKEIVNEREVEEMIKKGKVKK